MNELIKHADHTIDTQELLKMVNDARKTCGESPVRNNKFIEKVLDELDGEDGYTKSVTVPQGGDYTHGCNHHELQTSYASSST